MSDDLKLARMANQIAAFFRPYPEAQAIAGVHDHIRAFWPPRMRETLVALADRGDASLDPLVIEAIRVLSTAPSPTAKEAAGPDEVGEIGSSDAG